MNTQEFCYKFETRHHYHSPTLDPGPANYSNLHACAIILYVVGVAQHVVMMEEVHTDDYNWPSDDEEDINWDWEDETSKYYICFLLICYNEYDIMLRLLVNY